MINIANLKKRLIDAYIQQLSKEADELVRKANEGREVQNRTYNMEDAYGWAIFYEGKERKRGYLNKSPKSKKTHDGWAKAGISANTGRGYLDDYFNNYKPSGKGLELVVVNAVYYTYILERGKQGGKGVKYRIISQMTQQFDELAKKYKGIVKTINVV